MKTVAIECGCETALRRKRAAASHFARTRGWLLAAIALIVGAVSVSASTARADDADDRRVRAGARLFRSLLAAEVALESKAAPDGALHIVVYGSDARLGREIADLIAANGEAGKSAIRDVPVKIEAISTLGSLPQAPPPVGVFLLSTQSDSDLGELIRWSAASRTVLYSPFEGDVERGVAAGIAIEAKVQPYLNLAALQSAGIEIKPFYLKVAKAYP